MKKLKSLHDLLQNLEVNGDNLHRIAISNIKDNEILLKRWWHRKYKTPPKSYEDYYQEELVIESLEDFYDKNPSEIDRFEAAVSSIGEKDWDGSMPDDYEAAIQRRLKKVNKGVDLSKYQDEREITEEEEKRILANLGKPGSTVENGKPVLTEDEFEDEFGES